MDDVDETATRLGELLAKATKGVWEIDTIKNEGSYGNGPDCVEGFESYKIISASGKSLLDSLNSETVEVHEDGPGELGEYHAWDHVAFHNFELIAAMKNALPALLSERKAMKAEIERLCKENERLGSKVCELSSQLLRLRRSRPTSDFQMTPR